MAVPMEGAAANAEVDRRVEEQVGAMRGQYDREWAEREARAAGAAAAEAARQMGAVRSTLKYGKPAAFYGDPSSLQDWIFAMELYMEAMGTDLNSRAAMLLATTSITLDAMKWWRLLSAKPDPPTTWNTFKAAILGHYLVQNTSKKAREELLRLRQSGSVYAYTQKFQALLLECPDMAESDRVFQFCLGLARSIKQQVDMQNPTTVLDAMRMAATLDSTFYGHRDRDRDKGFTSRRYQTYNTGPSNMELGAMSATQVTRGRGRGRGRGRVSQARPPLQPQRDMSQIQCYNCGQKGHMARNCTRQRQENARA